MSGGFLKIKKMGFALLAVSLLLPSGLFAQSGAGINSRHCSGCEFGHTNGLRGPCRQPEHWCCERYEVKQRRLLLGARPVCGHVHADLRRAGNEEIPRLCRASGRAGCCHQPEADGG